MIPACRVIDAKGPKRPWESVAENTLLLHTSGASPVVHMSAMDRKQVDDAATLLTLLRRGKHTSSISSVLSVWDMLQADVPSREQLETAISILVGSGFAQVEQVWILHPREAGRHIKRAVKKGRAMRLIPEKSATW